MNTAWLRPFVRRVERTMIKNAPHILMGVGTTATISALIFAVKATPTALEEIEVARKEKTRKLIEESVQETGQAVVPRVTKLSIPETIKACGKFYIPAFGMEVLALACFWGAHGIDIRRQAVLSGLCATAEEALREYQHKAQELIGEKGEREVRNAIAQDRADRLPAPPDENPLPPGSKDNWCVISYGERKTSPYFLSSYAKIKDAQNDLNHQMISEMYATESDLFWLLDPEKRWLKTFGHSGEVGWTVDRMLVLEVTETDGPDHERVYVISYKDKDGCDYLPQPGFSKMY